MGWNSVGVRFISPDHFSRGCSPRLFVAFLITFCLISGANIYPGNEHAPHDNCSANEDVITGKITWRGWLQGGDPVSVPHIPGVCLEGGVSRGPDDNKNFQKCECFRICVSHCSARSRLVLFLIRIAAVEFYIWISSFHPERKSFVIATVIGATCTCGGVKLRAITRSCSLQTYLETAFLPNLRRAGGKSLTWKLPVESFPKREDANQLYEN
jgi:hypothetical protein